MATEKNSEVTTIPIDEISLLEVDSAIYNWLNIKHPTTINERRVPVIFGAWERFAQIQGNKTEDKINEMRDRHGRVRLPLISIRRGDVVPNEERYMKTTPDGDPGIVFHKEIATSKNDKDRRVAFNKWKLSNDRYIESDPVYAVYKLPFPTFINVDYTITFWASYARHANEFHHNIWNDYRLSDLEYKGFFFYSNFESSSNESNTEDFSTEERIIRHSFQLNVQAYLIDKEKDVHVDRSVSRFTFDEMIVESGSVEDIDVTTLDENIFI